MEHWIPVTSTRTVGDPGRGHWRMAAFSQRARTVCELTVLSGALLAPLAGLLRYQGPPMEEGFMLVFPEQVMNGRVPHVDFLHLYGPGSLWVLAGIYRVFGVTLAVERTVGFVQHVAVVVGIWALLRPWGRRVSVAGGLVAVVLIVTPLGLSALAWNGALGLAVCGLALGRLAGERLAHDEDASTARLLVGSGVLAGAALLYRPDLIIAVGAAFAVMTVTMVPRGRRRQVVVPLLATTSLYAAHLAISGIGPSFRGMFVEPVFKLRGGRSLPIPPSWGSVDGFLQRAGALRTTGWPLPMPALAHQITLWFWLVPISALGTAAVAWWPRRGKVAVDRLDPVARHRIRTLRVASVFGLAVQTQAFQRPDTAHLSWVTVVTFPLVIAALAQVLSERRTTLPVQLRSWVAIAPIAVVMVAIIPFYPLRTYADLVGQSLGRNRFGSPIRRGDRVFYYGDRDAAAAAQAVTDRLGSELHRGQRLIVGPRRLSRTPYSDAFLYYLFPELVPGTRYIEMDPGIADAADSGLAEELRRSDWLIQSTTWQAWSEPNDSRLDGSPEPDAVVAAHYCLDLDAGSFRLMRRCR